MNVFVNILKILIILVAIAVAVVVIMCAALVLFPGFSIFGLHYISGDNKPIGKEYNLVDNSAEWETVSTIWVKTNTWNIDIHPVTSGESEIFVNNCINARWTRLYNGFVFGEVKEPTFEGAKIVTVDGETRLLFEVAEPDGGWLSKNNTKLTILYDNNVFANKNLLIETNTGVIELGNDINFATQKLTINSEKGAVTINKITAQNDLEIAKSTGDITVNCDINQNVKIDINSGYGRINMQNAGAIDKAVVLGFDKPLNNVNVQFGDVTGDLEIKANGGLVRGGNVSGSLNVDVKSCDIYLENINGVSNYLGVDGIFKASKLNGVFDANITGNGRVELGETNGKSTIKTNNGEIKIESAKADVDATSQGGNINITGANNKINLYIKNRNGNTVLDKIKGTVNFAITDKGRGAVTVNYANEVGAIVGENVITTETGTIAINLNSADKFFYKKWSTNNKVNIELSGCRSTDKENTTGSPVNGAESTDTNNLTTTSVAGAINVLHYTTN